MKVNGKELFLKPGKTNQEERENFIKFWVAYMKQVSDKEWSRQQNVLINSQMKSARVMRKALKA